MRFGVDSSRKLGVMVEDPPNSSFGYDPDGDQEEWCYELHNLDADYWLDTSAPPPPAKGPRQPGVDPPPPIKMIHIKGQILSECRCLFGERDDQGCGKILGDEVNPCDADGKKNFVYTKSTRGDLRCFKEDNEYGGRRFKCSKTYPPKEIDEWFPLSDLLAHFQENDPDAPVYNNSCCINVPQNSAARQWCEDVVVGLPPPSKRGCAKGGKALGDAAKACGADTSGFVELVPPGEIPPKFECVNMCTDGVKDCLLGQMGCGGDGKIQAAILLSFLCEVIDDFFSEGEIDCTVEGI